MHPTTGEVLLSYSLPRGIGDAMTAGHLQLAAVSRSRAIHSSWRFWLVGAKSGSVMALLSKRQLVDSTILRGQIWSPTQQGCGVPEPPGSVNIRKLHLTYRFGRHAPPVGNLLPLPA